VMPSRAVYFWAYSSAKRWNSQWAGDGPLNHLTSAGMAGFMACSATNPIWLVKTRIQLDETANHKRPSASAVIRAVYAREGLRGFYKGMTASYYGISETVVHWLVYERVRLYFFEQMRARCEAAGKEVPQDLHFTQYSIAGAISKSTATILCYPHEVARTRLREGSGTGRKYRNFWQTLALVLKEEGHRGLYRGLCTQLVRQIPNSAIMMGTYESIVAAYNVHVQRRAVQDWEAECRQRKTAEDQEAQLRARLC